MILTRPLPSWLFWAQVEATPWKWFHFLSVCINLASKLQIEPSQTYLSLFPKVLRSVPVVLIMLIVLLSPKLLVPSHSSEYLAKIVLPVLFHIESPFPHPSMMLFLESHFLSELPIVCVIVFAQGCICSLLYAALSFPKCLLQDSYTISWLGTEEVLGGFTDIALNSIISHCERCIPSLTIFQ